MTEKWRNNNEAQKKSPAGVFKTLTGYCRSAGDRTLDPMIKSHVLYQLSYGPKAVQR